MKLTTKKSQQMPKLYAESGSAHYFGCLFTGTLAKRRLSSLSVGCCSLLPVSKKVKFGCGCTHDFGNTPWYFLAKRRLSGLSPCLSEKTRCARYGCLLIIRPYPTTSSTRFISTYSPSIRLQSQRRDDDDYYKDGAPPTIDYEVSPSISNKKKSFSFALSISKARAP